MKETAFFPIALESIDRETKRLQAFCDTLDKQPAEKKKQIAEYKKAKYRYAGVSNVWAMFFFTHRLLGKHKDTHYLHPNVEPFLLSHPSYLSMYDNAPGEEKPEYGMYYGALAFTDTEIVKLEEKYPFANDWEKIELEERLDGMRFAKECLNEAWQKRKEVSA